MIKEFSASPKPTNNNAKIVFWITFAISIIGFAIYFLMERYRGFVGMFALLTLTTAILFYTKYIAPVFYYDITFDSENAPIFVVRQLTGKRGTTLCRIDLADVMSVVKETKDERRAHKTPQNMRKYVYSPTLSPEFVYRMTVYGRYEKAEIILECNDDFAELIRNYAAEAKELRMAEEE